VAFPSRRNYYKPIFGGFSYPPKLLQAYFQRVFLAAENYYVIGVPHIPFQFYTSFKLKDHTYTVIHSNIIHSTLIHTQISSIQWHKIHTHLIYTQISSIQHEIHYLIRTQVIHKSWHKSIWADTSKFHPKHTSLIQKYRLGNFHYTIGGGGSLELPLEAKRALTKSEPGRGG
jgi:hypothetical protein